MGRRGETVTIVADDDSYGPTPPPPPYPHPDDVANDAGAGGLTDDEEAPPEENLVSSNNVGPSGKKKSWMMGFAGRGKAVESRNEVQIQGIEDVLKDDPPADRTTEMYDDKDVRRESLMDDTDNDAEDVSVEIPPTRVVQRMAHEEEVDEVKRVDNGKWTRLGAVAACLLVVLAIILGVGYGTGAFQSQSASGGGGGSGGSGGSSDPNRPAAVSSYLKSISLQGDGYFANTTNTTDPGTLASNWLITDDPLQLTPGTEADKFRLGQRYALLTFWFSSRSYWTNYTGWANTEDECTWSGVTCEVAELEGAGEVNVVTRLEMNNNGVQAISSDLFLLSNLKVLSLSNNVISGPLPPSLANASSLTELYLDTNGLQQDLSSFDWSKLVNLEVLMLSSNVGLNGTINDSLWALTKLEQVGLDGCRFSGELGGAGTVEYLQSLKVFDASNNRGGRGAGFSGSLPTAFVSLPKLEVLGLGGNRIDGSIPTEYASFSALTDLDIGYNQLTGNVPEDLSSLSTLKTLRVGGNTGLGGGSIPSLFYKLTQLEVLDISGLNFDGQIDSAIGNLVNLVELNISSNVLTSAPPTEMQAMTSLKTLEMQSNFFSGPMDFVTAMGSLVELNVATNIFAGVSDMSALSNLQFFSAQGNQFGSSFPETLASLPSLAYLDLSNSGLTGSLPTSVGGMSALETLILSLNSITGPIPGAVSGMSSLRVLKLDENRLSSSLPSSITALSNLEELELQKNRLTGSLPADVGALYSMRTFRINNNVNNGNPGITGPLPSSLSNMKFLEVLEVYSNGMTGKLPTEMGGLDRLRYLDIEYNGFTGTIPTEWAKMTSLAEFYLSNTQLTGAMPADICTIPAIRFLVPDCTITGCGCCSSCN